ncbi:Fungal specific transcription factor [Neophaeococcomyces mojaviensis]|uniref:Fungal specific transcription factor n=1 Tax=Neophaeococcomyces mojaviensis TaxID=3383035 RepID=A0ACC3AJ21_9EURO|nr:Fungal specific transcription factor [Knufia sp. JES_112]
MIALASPTDPLISFSSSETTNLPDPQPTLAVPSKSLSDSGRVTESLLKNTLGQVSPSLTAVPIALTMTGSLQTHQYAKYIGATDEHDVSLLDLRLYDDYVSESAAENVAFRKVGYFEFFRQYADIESPSHAREIEDLDTIQRIVHPHGEALVKLYFRVVHPAFPILHKRVFVEKYARGYREFSPPLLAAIYILALNWWTFDPALAKLPRPDVGRLQTLAFRSLSEVATRAKLSTVQAGILLLQRSTPDSTWQLTSQLVAIGQDLGLHLDCTHWRIPTWERALRKRLAWALFMQDTWSALIYGRPPHITPQNWAVQPIIPEDYPESPNDEADGEDDADSPLSADDMERGRTTYTTMIQLTKLLAEILESLYSQKSELEIRQSFDSTKAVLERAKPIQLKLRAFFADMPECLRMDSTTNAGKISSVGYLHLAYFATEITLHRRVIRSLSAQTDPYLIQICRSAAKARLISALEYFNRLKPEHLQSFWYFASKFNFALIGTFAGLCFVTSVSHEEAAFYQMRLQEYRWVLRISRKNMEFLEIASGILESAVGVLLRNADSLDSKKLAFPMLQQSVDDSPTGPMEESTSEDGYGEYAEGTGTDDAYYEDVTMGSSG